MQIHIVKQGETVESIAQTYGVSEERINFDNQLFVIGGLIEGQSLLIQIPKEIYTVQEGDTVESIAAKFEISTKALLQNNPVLLIDEVLNTGEQIVIQYEGEKIGNIVTDGFAYPFINEGILTETLLYLSELSCFSYGFTTTGELIPLDDESLLARAFQFDVSPILVLTSLTELGVFNNELVTILVNDMTVQENVINNLVQTVQAKNYSGVNLDFEFITAQDKDAYVSFVQNVRNRMNEIGRTVTVCLAPKISDEQEGLVYEGVDYEGLGNAADYAFVMTYEWGYTYSSPMPVSPINKIREVLDYAVTKIEPAKIRMGISNYGYDWPLPYEKGVTEAAVIGNVQAVAIARENKVVIQYDEVAQTPFFNYTLDGVTHEVWFEDVRSINAKIRLVTEYGLNGAGYWTIMKAFRGNWLLVNELYTIQ